MSFNFGNQSLKVRSTLCPELQLVVDDVIKVYNVSLIEGHRDKETQDRYFETGVSKLKWPNSRHNSNPSDAVDAWPYLMRLADVSINEALSGHPSQIARIAKLTGRSEATIWRVLYQEYATMKGVFLAVAAKHGIQLRFGDDWDRDFDRLDQGFIDLPHVEVVR